MTSQQFAKQYTTDRATVERRLQAALGLRHHVAEDIAQEAWLVAWQQLATYKGKPERFGGWVTRIAVNLYLQEVRRMRAMGQLVCIDDAPEVGVEYEDEFLRRLDLEIVLRKLPAEVVAGLMLSMDGRSTLQQCREAGVPRSTFERHRDRFLGSVRKRYLGI